MAPLRQRTHDAIVLLLVVVLQRASCAEDEAAAAAREMVAVVPTMPPRPNTLPSCPDPVTEKPGYEPVCPVGYFRCCATCSGATCYSEKGLQMSWRGIRECIRCYPGDYCAGCDTYQRCRPSEVPGRIGPKISPIGSVRAQDCEICPAGFEADLDRQRCVKRWKDVCNEKYVGRCYRNCRAEDPRRMKNLNFCEKMKCQLYCAQQWSSACTKAFAHECEYRKLGPSEYDLFSESEEWLTDCDVDCNAALGRHSLALLAWTGIAAVGMLRWIT